MWKRLFTTIRYADAESASPRMHSDFEIESQHLDGYNKLSEEMKSFSIIAQAQHINYIKEKLSSKKQLVTRSIPVTIDKVQIQSAKSSMKKEELILIIESLIRSLNETNWPQFQGLKSKRKDELLIILQEVRDLTN
ncbi:16393_t:CDS:2, partial [Funneliformis caledonium]